MEPSLKAPLLSRSGERLWVYAFLPHPGAFVDPATPLAVSCHGYLGAGLGTKNRFLSEVFTKAGFAYVSFDFTGHGEATGSLETATLQHFILDLGSVISWLGEQTGREQLTYSLLGSSMGGRVSLLHAANAPEVRSVVVFAPLLNPRNSSLASEDEATWTPLYRSLRNTDAYAAVEAIEAPLCVIHGRNDELLPVADTQPLRERRMANPAPFALCLTDADHRFSTPAMRDSLGEIALAWHVLYGKHDAATKRR